MVVLKELLVLKAGLIFSYGNWLFNLFFLQRRKPGVKVARLCRNGGFRQETSGSALLKSVETMTLQQNSGGFEHINLLPLSLTQ